MSSSSQPDQKSARLNVRLTPRALERIREAAELTGQDVTSFVLDAALARARDVLAEEMVITLSPMDARDVLQALDHEARPVPQLVELLRRRGGATPEGLAEAGNPLVAHD